MTLVLWGGMSGRRKQLARVLDSRKRAQHLNFFRSQTTYFISTNGESLLSQLSIPNFNMGLISPCTLILLSGPTREPPLLHQSAPFHLIHCNVTCCYVKFLHRMQVLCGQTPRLYPFLSFPKLSNVYDV